MNRHKFIIPALIFMLFTVISESQEVVAPAGNHFANEEIQISWTLGEPVIETISNGQAHLTQGFHQPILIITALAEIPDISISILAYPNPTSNYLNVKINKLPGAKLYYILYNIEGKILQTKPLISDVTEIPMNNYVSATYFLKISNKNKCLKIFKIVKN